MAANGWTKERRRRQAEMIRRWKPWERSTGPKTAVGRTTSSRNAYKGGGWLLIRQLSRALKEQREIISPTD